MEKENIIKNIAIEAEDRFAWNWYVVQYAKVWVSSLEFFLLDSANTCYQLTGTRQSFERSVLGYGLES
jgi:hypothetical protein